VNQGRMRCSIRKRAKARNVSVGKQWLEGDVSDDGGHGAPE
jgi:hypothetical protein